MASFYSTESGRVTESNFYPQSYGVGFISFDERDVINELLGEELLDKLKSTKFTVYERKDSYQYIVLNTPMWSKDKLYEKVVIYLDMRGVLVFSERANELSGITGDFAGKIGGKEGGYFLSAFLLSLLAHDYIYMEGVEKELGKVETKILKEHTPNFAEKINSYRRKVAVIKRYYEQLYEVTQTLSEEDFLASMKEDFTKINTKVERLREEALYLRDYMSQVREAYQQGVDLSLNSVMKFLSAATLIFAPLQFLVGWFGMNFEMPETENPVGYAIPFVASVVIVVVALYIFKRKKWF